MKNCSPIATRIWKLTKKSPYSEKWCAFICVLYNFAILHIDFIKELGVFLFSKLYFYLFICSCCEVVRPNADYYFLFSSLNSFLMLHISLVGTKLEYASVVWSAEKVLYLMLQQISSTHNLYSYNYVLDKLDRIFFFVKRRHIEASL